MPETTIIYHLGAPHPNLDMITGSLRRDNGLLRQHNCLARKPRLYRNALTEAVIALQLGDFSPEDRVALFSKLTQDLSLHRLLLSDGTFLAQLERVFSDEKLYSEAGRRTAELRALFPDNPVEFMLAITNPAALVSALMVMNGKPSAGSLLRETDIRTLRWSRVLEDIRSANPDCPIRVWRRENRMLLWPTIMRKISGIPKSVALAGDADMCAEVLADTQFAALSKFLEERPELSFGQRGKVMASFLQKFSKPETIALPGFDEETLNEIEESYLEDVEACKKIDGVEFLT